MEAYYPPLIVGLYIIGVGLVVGSGAVQIYRAESPSKGKIVYHTYRWGVSLLFIAGVLFWLLSNIMDRILAGANWVVVILGYIIIVLFGIFAPIAFLGVVTGKWVRSHQPDADFPPLGNLRNDPTGRLRKR